MFLSSSSYVLLWVILIHTSQHSPHIPYTSELYSFCNDHTESMICYSKQSYLRSPLQKLEHLLTSSGNDDLLISSWAVIFWQDSSTYKDTMQYLSSNTGYQDMKGCRDQYSYKAGWYTINNGNSLPSVIKPIILVWGMFQQNKTEQIYSWQH
jgi:hypothetical protein